MKNLVFERAGRRVDWIFFGRSKQSFFGGGELRWSRPTRLLHVHFYFFPLSSLERKGVLEVGLEYTPFLKWGKGEGGRLKLGNV